jgi:hypothetical protein
MSIATDEAENKFGDTESWMNRDPERNSYVAGRTAEPTEAEIEAAAKRIFTFLNGPWQGKHYELVYVDGLAIADAAWETADKRRYEACAEFALEDARKAVTGNE